MGLLSEDRLSDCVQGFRVAIGEQTWLLVPFLLQHILISGKI